LIDRKDQPKAVQASSSKIQDPSQMHLRSKKATGRKHQWFIQIGSSSSSRNWTRYDKASAQVKAGQRPPWTSIKLSIQLFLDATVVTNTIDELNVKKNDENGETTSSDEQDNLTDKYLAGNPEETTEEVRTDDEEFPMDDGQPNASRVPMDEDPPVVEHPQVVNEPMNEEHQDENTSTPAAAASYSRPAVASMEDVENSTYFMDMH